MPNPIEELLAQLSGGQQPQPPQDEAPPQINPTADMSALSEAAPDQAVTNIGARPPSQSQIMRDKLFSDLQSRQQEMSRVDADGRDGYKRLIASTLGDQDAYAKKKVEERFSGKMGTAKAILIDFLGGLAQKPGDIKESIKQDATKEYQKASDDVISQEKSKHQQMLEQANVLHQQTVSEKNDDTMQHYKDLADKYQNDARIKELTARNKATTDAAKITLQKNENESKDAYRKMVAKSTGEKLDLQRQKGLKATNAIELAQKQAEGKGLKVGTPEYLKDVQDTLTMASKAHYAYKPAPSTMAAGGGFDPKDPANADMLRRDAELINAGGKVDISGNSKLAFAYRMQAKRLAAELDPNGSLAKAQAEFSGTKQGMNAIIKNKSQVEAFAKTASDTLDLVGENSSKVARTGMPLYNHFLLWKKGEVDGDDDTAVLKNSIDTATTEYARVMTGSMSGPVTDGMRTKAEGMLSAAMADHTVPKVIAFMKKEMAIRKNSFTEEIKSLSDGIGSRTATPSSSAPKAAQRWNPKTNRLESAQ